jgi:hypothetical protein
MDRGVWSHMQQEPRRGLFVRNDLNPDRLAVNVNPLNEKPRRVRATRYLATVKQIEPEILQRQCRCTHRTPL